MTEKGMEIARELLQRLVGDFPAACGAAGMADAVLRRGHPVEEKDSFGACIFACSEESENDITVRAIGITAGGYIYTAVCSVDAEHTQFGAVHILNGNGSGTFVPALFRWAPPQVIVTLGGAPGWASNVLRGVLKNRMP